MSSRALQELWSDDVRKIRTLESFSKTEEDGGLDLRAAARRVLDQDLKKSLLLHADDELRHAELFRTRARELRSNLGVSPESESLRAYDTNQARVASAMDAHGFFTSGLCDEMGEVAYVAMLNVAERHAAELFERHSRALVGDPATRAVFEAILKDEKFHVAYTAKALERFRREGRASEVKAGLQRAQSSRFLGGWKRLGARAAGSFGRAVLWVLYWTLFLPFAWAASRRSRAPGWHTPAARRAGDQLRSQY